MFLFSYKPLRINLLLMLLCSTFFSVSIHTKSISDEDKEMITRSFGNISVPPVWNGDHVTFIKQPNNYAIVDLGIIVLLLSLLSLFIYNHIKQWLILFVKLNKKGITLPDGSIILWEELELVNEKNIKIKQIIGSAQSRDKVYSAILVKKGSKEVIELPNYAYTSKRIEDFILSIQAYQKAYGEKGSGRLNTNNIKGRFDPLTNTLKVGYYMQSIIELVCALVIYMFLILLVYTCAYDYDVYRRPLLYPLCSIDKEEGITNHVKQEKKYSWEEITGAIKDKRYDLLKKRNGEKVIEPHFQYGFGVEGGLECIFKERDIPSYDIFSNVIKVYKGTLEESSSSTD